MNNTNNEFTCKYKNCFKYYKKPIFLPCGYSMCQEHLTQDAENLNEFECVFCEETHSIPDKGFPLVKSLMEVMSSNKYLNDDQKKVREVLDKLSLINNELTTINNDPERFIFDYFSNIKNQMDSDRERIKLEIDLIYENFFSHINQFESECRFNLKNMQNQNEIIKSNDKKLKELNEEFRKPNLSLVNHLSNEAWKALKKNELILKSFKNDLLKKKFCFFKSKNFKVDPLTIGELKIEDEDFTQNLTENFGTCLKVYSGHTASVGYVKSIDKLKQLITSSYSPDKTIKIWNSETGQCLYTFPEQESTINCFCILSDTKFISGGALGEIKIWDLNTKAILKSIKESKGIFSLCKLPNNQIALGILDSPVIIRDSNNLTLISEMKDSSKSATSLSYLNESLIVSSKDGSIEIWNINTLECIHKLIGHENKVFGLEILVKNDKNLLFSGSYDGCLKIWDLNSGKCLETLNVKQRICALKFVTKRLLAIGLGTLSENVLIYDTSTNDILRRFKAHASSVYNFEVLENGTFLTCSEDKTIKRWQI